MNKSRVIAILTIIFIIVALTACKDPISKLLKDKSDTVDVNFILNEELLDENDGFRKTVLYYRDDKGFLVPVMRKIPWEEGIAKSALMQLVDQPMVRADLATVGLLPVLPPGTNIIGISIDDGLCKVDFTENILTYQSETDENAIVGAVLYTLTEFESIDRVQILVNGKTISKLIYGTKLGAPLERGKINLSYELTENSIPVIVYYKATTDGENSFFVPVTKGINALKADIKTVLVALLEGAPEGSGLYSEIPIGSKINNVYVKEGIAYIDFSEEIKRIPQNAYHQQSLVYELGLTLREIESSISQVRILSGGKEIELSSEVSLNLPDYSNEH